MPRPFQTPRRWTAWREPRPPHPSWSRAGEQPVPAAALSADDFWNRLGL